MCWPVSERRRRADSSTSAGGFPSFPGTSPARGAATSARLSSTPKTLIPVTRSPITATITGATATTQVNTPTGTPQGGILSPLLANIALSVLDEHLHARWQPGAQLSTRVQRAKRVRHREPNWRVVRYADDFVVLVHGERDHVEDLREQVADVLAPMGLNLSQEKTPDCAHGRGVRLPRVPHPVAPQAREQQVVRLHLHR